MILASWISQVLIESTGLYKQSRSSQRGCHWFLHSMSFYFKEWHTHTPKYIEKENGDETEMKVRGFGEEIETFREAKSTTWGFYTGYQRLV